MGCRDTYMGEYGYNYVCFYRKRNASNSNLSQITYETRTHGPFWAKKLQPDTYEKMTVDSLFMFDTSAMTFKTLDTIDVQAGDRVIIGGTEYNVLNIQRKELWGNSEFDNTPSAETYISIKGA